MRKTVDQNHYGSPAPLRPYIDTFIRLSSFAWDSSSLIKICSNRLLILNRSEKNYICFINCLIINLKLLIFALYIDFVHIHVTYIEIRTNLKLFNSIPAEEVEYEGTKFKFIKFNYFFSYGTWNRDIIVKRVVALVNPLQLDTSSNELSKERRELKRHTNIVNVTYV